MDEISTTDRLCIFALTITTRSAAVPQPFGPLPDQIELSAFDCRDRFEAGEEFAGRIEKNQGFSL